MTESIPAGMYAKEYLKNIEVWEKLKVKYVESVNVRAALNFVARNDLEYGIVYKTDAINNKAVSILYDLEKDNHDKIIYPITILNEKKQTINFYNFLLSENSLLNISKWGFKTKND